MWKWRSTRWCSWDYLLMEGGSGANYCKQENLLQKQSPLFAIFQNVLPLTGAGTGQGEGSRCLRKLYNHKETPVLLQRISTAVWSWARDLAFVGLASYGLSQKRPFLGWGCSRFFIWGKGSRFADCTHSEQSSDSIWGSPWGSLLVYKSSQWLQHFHRQKGQQDGGVDIHFSKERLLHHIWQFHLCDLVQMPN